MDNKQLYEVPLLSRLAMAHRNRKMIADQIFPFVAVPNKEVKYNIFDRSDAFRRQKTILTGKASANVVDLAASKATHTLKDRAQAAWLTEDERKQAGEYALEPLKINLLKDILSLDLELEVAGKLRDATAYPTALKDTLSGTTQWSHSSSKPKKAVIDAKAAMKLPANVFIVGLDALNALLLHGEILDAVKYTQGAIDVMGVLARYFGVERFLVGEGYYNTAAPGQAENFVRVWGKDAILLHVDDSQSPLLEAPSAGYMPIYNGGIGGNSWRVYTKQPDPERGAGEGAKYLKVEGTYDPLIHGLDGYGFLFINAVA